MPNVATCCGVLPCLASRTGPLLKDRSFRVSKTGILEAWRLSEWVNWASVAPQVFIIFSGFQRPKARNVWRPVADLASTSSSFLKDRNFRLFESSRLGYLASWANWPSLVCCLGHFLMYSLAFEIQTMSANTMHRAGFAECRCMLILVFCWAIPCDSCCSGAQEAS